MRSGLLCYVKQVHHACVKSVYLKMADKVFVHVCAVVAQLLSGPCMCGVSRQRDADAGAGACGRCGGLPAWIISCMIKKSHEVIASLLTSHYPDPLYISCVSG